MKLSYSLLLVVLLLASSARAQDAPDKSVDAPPPPAPASRSGALWAALSSFRKGTALEDVLAASGYAYRATACADDCPCIEWREEALSVLPAATILGLTDAELDLAKNSPEVAFAAIKESIAAGRAPFYAGPREVGVVYGYKDEPR